MKVFISQKMNGLTDEEVLKTRNEVTKMLEEKYGEIEVIDSYFKTNVPEGAGRVWYLGDSISLLDGADAVYFADGWEDAKGCIVEYIVCGMYGLRVLNKES